jgi:hypothetical protein
MTSPKCKAVLLTHVTGLHAYSDSTQAQRGSMTLTSACLCPHIPGCRMMPHDETAHLQHLCKHERLALLKYSHLNLGPSLAAKLFHKNQHMQWKGSY